MRCRRRSPRSTRGSGRLRSVPVVGILATLWYVPGRLFSEDFLTDSLSALSLLIAFYYGLTGVACAVYWRHELLRSAKNFLFIGVAPLLGAGMLTYLLIESARQLANPENSVTGSELFGVGMPLGVAILFTGLGFVAMLAWRFLGPTEARDFFARRPFGAVPRDVAAGGGRVDAIGSPRTTPTPAAPAGGPELMPGWSTFPPRTGA